MQNQGQEENIIVRYNNEDLSGPNAHLLSAHSMSFLIPSITSNEQPLFVNSTQTSTMLNSVPQSHNNKQNRSPNAQPGIGRLKNKTDSL